MKRILASMAVLAIISACSEEPAAPAAEETTAAPAGPTMESYVGEWNVSLADGSTHVTTNNADGTFSRQMADGTGDGGKWVYTAGLGCWTPDGGEEACYTVGTEDANGVVTLTATDGTTMTATRVVAEAAPAEAAPAAE